MVLATYVMVVWANIGPDGNPVPDQVPVTDVPTMMTEGAETVTAGKRHSMPSAKFYKVLP